MKRGKIIGFAAALLIGVAGYNAIKQNFGGLEMKRVDPVVEMIRTHDEIQKRPMRNFCDAYKNKIARWKNGDWNFATIDVKEFLGKYSEYSSVFRVNMEAEKLDSLYVIIATDENREHVKTALGEYMLEMYRLCEKNSEK